MRSIDADYLKQMFDVACGTNREVFNIADYVYNFAIKIIDDAPTIEPTIRWTDKVSIRGDGDIIDFNGQLIGHINLDDMRGNNND